MEECVRLPNASAWKRSTDTSALGKFQGTLSLYKKCLNLNEWSDNERMGITWEIAWSIKQKERNETTKTNIEKMPLNSNDLIMLRKRQHIHINDKRHLMTRLPVGSFYFCFQLPLPLLWAHWITTLPHPTLHTWHTFYYILSMRPDQVAPLNPYPTLPHSVC